jgi:hypothetical protein
MSDFLAKEFPPVGNSISRETVCSKEDWKERPYTCLYLFQVVKFIERYFDCGFSTEIPDKQTATENIVEDLWSRRSSAENSLLSTVTCKLQPHRREQLQSDRLLFENGLLKCFSQSFGLRQKSLGWNHLDKGIYFDQLVRWLINFPFPENYQIIYSERFFKEPSLVIEELVTGLRNSSVINSEVSAEDILYQAKRLYHPNNRSASHSLSEEQRKSLHDYYSVYNKVLLRILR